MTQTVSKKQKYPFASVIIPVLNAKKYLPDTLKALDEQTYPQDRFEIILIDNGSGDGTLEYLLGTDYITLHNSRARNPYISRNMGAEKAKGEILVFLDITCTPTEHWLEEGVNSIINGADLVGGNIKFKYHSTNPTLGEWYDSITFVNVEEYIKRFKSAVGGNLFVSREVWRGAGAFPEDMRSGADSYWTRRASAKGYTLTFAENATVSYPARELKGVIKKSYRVGKGHVRAWIKEKQQAKDIVLEIIKTFSPPSVKEIRSKIDKRGIAQMHNYIFHLWFISWINKAAMGLGRASAFLTAKSKAKDA